MTYMADIYEKKCEGGHISNSEILKGIVFFKDLSSKLAVCGPVFKLAFKEANNTYDTLYGYAVARGLKIPE
jgi:hypothetical protein